MLSRCVIQTVRVQATRSIFKLRLPPLCPRRPVPSLNSLIFGIFNFSDNLYIIYYTWNITRSKPCLRNGNFLIVARRSLCTSPPPPGGGSDFHWSLLTYPAYVFSDWSLFCFVLWPKISKTPGSQEWLKRRIRWCRYGMPVVWFALARLHINCFDVLRL
jgi:hypothetical protein